MTWVICYTRTGPSKAENTSTSPRQQFQVLLAAVDREESGFEVMHLDAAMTACHLPGKVKQPNEIAHGCLRTVAPQGLIGVPALYIKVDADAAAVFFRWWTKIDAHSKTADNLLQG
ncbi:MAG: hypothetical protein ABJJ37_05105 [Roseibium sp.]